MSAILTLATEETLTQYFQDLDGECPSAIYDMVTQQVEVAMIAFVLKKTEGNQTRAAQWLGLNRNTLRKKIQTYGLE